MKTEHPTITSIFSCVAFSDFPHTCVLFALFLLIYLAILCGTLLIVSLICYDSHLHKPMYSFITNLSFIDVSLTSNIFPKMLFTFFEERQYITFKKCLTQLYIFRTTEVVEFGVLTAMAYDRSVAICNPLRYTVIMNRAVCCQLTSASLMFGLIVPIPHTVITSQLSFCNSHQINHFFCAFTALTKISCRIIRNIQTLNHVFGIIVVPVCFFLILMSHIYLISIIMKIQSVLGRVKGISICTSHLTVVLLLNGTKTFAHIRLASKYSMNQNKTVSHVLWSCGAVPRFRPIIYTLNKKELKEASKKAKSLSRK